MGLLEHRAQPILEVVKPIPPGMSLGTHPTTGEDIVILLLKSAKITK